MYLNALFYIYNFTHRFKLFFTTKEIPSQSTLSPVSEFLLFRQNWHENRLYTINVLEKLEKCKLEKYVGRASQCLAALTVHSLGALIG